MNPPVDQLLASDWTAYWRCRVEGEAQAGNSGTQPGAISAQKIRAIVLQHVAARQWQQLLKVGGEHGIIVKVRLLADSSTFNQWLHLTPMGRVVEVPLHMLGEIIEVLD